MPKMDAVLTMAPPLFFSMAGICAFMPKNTPERLVLITCAQASSA